MFWRKIKAAVTESAPIRICEDCKWFRPYSHSSSLELSKCANPLAQARTTHTLVAHRPSAEALAYCCNAREFDSQCGKQGKHFESKPKPVHVPPPPPYLSVLQNIDCSLLRIAKVMEQPPKVLPTPKYRRSGR